VSAGCEADGVAHGLPYLVVRIIVGGARHSPSTEMTNILSVCFGANLRAANFGSAWSSLLRHLSRSAIISGGSGRDPLWSAGQQWPISCRR